MGWLFLRWDIRRFLAVALGTFLISLVSNYGSNSLLNLLPFLPAFGVLIAIILVGILFDIIGVAATAADEVPFHAMASDKILGAKEAMWVVRNAASVATLCNDMIGDIAGTLSGAVGTSIAFAIFRETSSFSQGMWVTLLVSGVAAVTVGGKAFGKDIAISKAGDIIHWVGKIMYGWEAITGLKITNLGHTVGTNKKRDSDRRRGRCKKA
jgi:CBS domain containing-hemolysin-like protein